MSYVENESQTNKLKQHMSISNHQERPSNAFAVACIACLGNSSERIVGKFCKPWWAHGPMRQAREAPAQVLGRHPLYLAVIRRLKDLQCNFADVRAWPLLASCVSRSSL